MSTQFAVLCQTCGLSQREAAEFLDVRIDTSKSWSQGRRAAPDGVIDALAALAEKIDGAAAAAIEQFADIVNQQGSPPDVIELGLAADDHEAQSLGWPCVGAHAAVLGLTIARGMRRGYRFAVVPRGSTVATAAADVRAHK